jgi:hypothetical protein
MTQLQEESAQSKKAAENSEALRAEISRKDATIKSQRDALQKTRESLSYTQESSALRTHDLEKQIRCDPPLLPCSLSSLGSSSVSQSVAEATRVVQTKMCHSRELEW